MNPYLYQQNLQQIQQTFMQGCSIGQQGMMMESMGNIPAACQCYEQAAGMVQNAIQAAQQMGMPVPDMCFFSLALAHGGAAQAQAKLGNMPQTMFHLEQARIALNQALALNPNNPQYHAAAGTVLAYQGNLPVAAQAFQNALNLNPADVYSRYMLGVVQTALGNTAAGSHSYQAVQQVAPNLPPPQQIVAAAAQNSASANAPSENATSGGNASNNNPSVGSPDWTKKLDSIGSFIKNCTDAVNAIGGLTGQGGSTGNSCASQPQMPGFNAGMGFNPNGGFNPSGGFNSGIGGGWQGW